MDNMLKATIRFRKSSRDTFKDNEARQRRHRVGDLRENGLEEGARETRREVNTPSLGKQRKEEIEHPTIIG